MLQAQQVLKLVKLQKMDTFWKLPLRRPPRQNLVCKIALNALDPQTCPVAPKQQLATLKEQPQLRLVLLDARLALEQLPLCAQ